MSGLDTVALVLRMADLFATVALVGASVFAWPTRRGVLLLLPAALLPLARLLTQGAALADPGEFFATLDLVAVDTRFGLAMLARAATIALWVALLMRGGVSARRLGLAFAAVDIALWAALGHGAASSRPWIGGIVLAVHVGAATVWIGGMAVALFGATRRDLAPLRGFAPLGLACVSLLVLTGLLNLQIAGGDIVAAFAGRYGVLLAAKLLCFAAMLLLAAINRYALLPAVPRQGVAGHRAMLALAAETLLGAVVLGLAALLASGPPPH